MIALSQRRCNPHRHVRSRPAYNFARGGSLWLPKERRIEAAGVAMAFSPAFADLGTGSTPLDWPGAANLLSWHHWRYAPTYSSTLYATGTTPPAVTFTGTVPVGCGLRLRISTGGTRGTMRFDWSTDNGTTYPPAQTSILSAATVNLGNGITLAFPNTGPYNTDNDYQLVITQWNDQTGNAHHWIPVDGTLPKAPIPTVTPYGTALGFQTTSHMLKCTTGYASSLVVGNDNSFYIAGIAGITNVTPTGTNSTLLFFGDGATNHCVDWFYSATQFKVLKTDDAATSKNPIGTSPAPGTSYHLYELFMTGTVVTMLIDGTAVTGISAADLDVGSLTVNQATLGKSFLSGAEGNAAAINWLEMLCYTSDMDATTRGDIRSRVRAPYGI